MNHKPLLSVIIPVYNQEKFLQTTINNVVDQFTADDSRYWELILVNDGSADGSISIMHQAADQYDNIIVINQTNAGASAARNAGLLASSGEYVYFLDGDDLLLKGVLSVVMDVIKTVRPDLIKFLLRHISPEEYGILKDNVPITTVTVADFKLMSPQEYLNATEAMTNPSGDCTVLTVYRRGLLSENSLKFNPDVAIGEDVDLIWHAMFCAENVAYCDQPLHLYNLHPNSVSRFACTERNRLLALADYLSNLFAIYKRYIATPALHSQGADAGFRNSIRYLTNHILSQQIISGEPLATIYQTMRRLKRAGADIHPGRPRFDQSVKKSANRTARLRRWVTSYILVLPIWLSHE